MTAPRHRRTTWRGIILPLCLVAFVLPFPVLATHTDAPPGSVKRLVFGVYAHIRPTELLKKMAPLQRYLHEYLSDRGQPTEVVLRMFPTYGEAIDALASGQVDFVRFGPVSYVLAKEKNPNIGLLVMESNDGTKRFNGVISVPEDSGVRSLSDLRGSRFAFGARRSTTGRYLAQAELFKAGLRAGDLAGYSYLGRHDKVAYSVATGNHDAGATNENTFYKYAGVKGLRKIHEFPCVTKPWVARSGMNPAVLEGLRQALLDLRNEDILKGIVRSGFLPAEDSDYDMVREAMALARKFDKASITVGVYASVRPSTIYGLVNPVVGELERELARDGDLETIRTRVFGGYRKTVDALIQGTIDLARLGPASYVLAKQLNPHLTLIAAEHHGKGAVRGLFVAPADSSLQTLAALRGKRFAFGDPFSTEGRYLAQAELTRAGLKAADLGAHNYLGRHDRVAHSVATGRYDAGVLRSTALEDNATRRQLKIIGEFEVPEKVWVARAGMDPDLLQDLRRLMFSLAPGDGPVRFRFVPAADHEFDRLRKDMELARLFEQ